MMKRLIVSCMIAFTALAAAGCAARKPEFNQTYLPNTVLGVPEKRIDLTKKVRDKAMVRSGLFGLSKTYLPTSLYWLKEDKLVFNIMSEDKKTVLQSFFIIPSIGQIKLLEDAEKDVLVSTMERSSDLVDIETAAGKFAKGAAQLLSFLFGREARFEEHSRGKIANNGFVLDFDISSRKKGGRTIFTSVYYDCNYVVKNRQTGNTFEGTVRIDGRRIKNLPHWLKSWRVSPDGRYYLIGETITLVDPEQRTFTPLIDNYEHEFAGFDISPRWDQIAILNIKKDEKTKQRNYWIEFYPFHDRNQ